MAVTLASIAEVLLRYHDQYRWLDVLSSQVHEFTHPAGCQGRKVGEKFFVQAHDQRLEVLLDGRGVARFALADEGPDGADVALGALIGAGIAAATATARTGAAGSRALFGLLAGGLLGAVASRPKPSPDANRVMALRFNEQAGRWEAYDGPWRQWAVDTLWPPPGVHAAG